MKEQTKSLNSLHEAIRQRCGFTLIELMIVVAIIAIIVSIALPNLLRSRMMANESAAIHDIRTIDSAQVSYNAAHLRYASFDELTSEAQGPGTAFLPGTWSEGCIREGYEFSMPDQTEHTFTVLASPETPGITGERYFRVDGSGVVRYSKEGTPEADAPEI